MFILTLVAGMGLLGAIAGAALFGAFVGGGVVEMVKTSRARSQTA